MLKINKMDYNYNETPLAVPSSHSIQADLATGWKPKLKIIGPMPLNFDNTNIDKAIKSMVYSETSFYSVVYLGTCVIIVGPRPTNTFQMHQIYAKKYKYKYLHLVHGDFAHLKSFFHKFYREFQPVSKRQFLGMNPNIKKHSVTFDSAFQSGNLDCAIRVRENEYDLILRIDSNTAGHILWYYFKVSNKENHSRTIKFSIVNLRRKMKSAYERGMKPFVKRKDQIWKQQGENVYVTQQRLSYNKESLLLQTINENYQAEEALFRKLKFELSFAPLEQIEVAYCIPYTYSEMINDIKYLRKKHLIEKSSMTFDIDFTNQSLSGLEIPLIKITEQNEEIPQKKKYCIFLIGRQHPGESNGSFVMKGIIDQILTKSEQWKVIRQNCVFQIIPMLNPDGVVIGNFRTSLYGKDLNRLFKSQDVSLIPEIQFSRSLLYETSKIHKNKFLLFLDIHGHSTRRNSFVFGPGILDANILSDIRYFPKIIATKTQIFRYPSCSFRINNDKKTTARALFTKYAGLSYTVQSSNWSYYSQKEGVMVEFNQTKWIEVGTALGLSIEDYICEKLKSRKNKLKKIEQAEIKLNQKGNKNQNKDKDRKTNKSIAIHENIQKTSKSKDKMEFGKQHNKQKERNRTEVGQLKEETQFNKFAQIQERQQQNESDRMSEQGMDTDSEGEDMEKDKFKNYIHSASKMIIEFEKAYYGDNYKKEKELQKEKHSQFTRNKGFNFKEKKKIEVLACLRKKEPTFHQLAEQGFVQKIKLEKKANVKDNPAQDRVFIKSQKKTIKESKWSIEEDHLQQDKQKKKMQEKPPSQAKSQMKDPKAESSNLLSSAKLIKKSNEKYGMDKHINFSEQMKNKNITTPKEMRFDFSNSKAHLQQIKQSLNVDRYNLLRSPDQKRADMSKVYEMIGRQSSSRRRSHSKKDLQPMNVGQMKAQIMRPQPESNMYGQAKEFDFRQHIPTFPKIIRPIQTIQSLQSISNEGQTSSSCKNINKEHINPKLLRDEQMIPLSEKYSEIIAVQNQINKNAHGAIMRLSKYDKKADEIEKQKS